MSFDRLLNELADRPAAIDSPAPNQATANFLAIQRAVVILTTPNLFTGKAAVIVNPLPADRAIIDAATAVVDTITTQESIINQLRDDLTDARNGWEAAVNDNNAYNHPLDYVFDEAVEQAARGKGEERHGRGKDFLEQPWVELTDQFGTGGLFWQAGKKLREAQHLKAAARRRELLGAINYIAMALVYDDHLADQKLLRELQQDAPLQDVNPHEFAKRDGGYLFGQNITITPTDTSEGGHV